MNLYPYTDFHELNDDWIIGHIKKDEKDIAALQNTIVNLNFEFDRKADKATTYTKTEVDTLLLGKANVSDIPDMSNYYDKSETDNLLLAKADTSSLATVATSGSYNDLLNKPTIPAAQVNSDWDAVSGVAQILNKPTLATVATSGNYNDLTNKPTIPAAQVNSDWNAVSGVQQILNKPKNLFQWTLKQLNNEQDLTIKLNNVTFGSYSRYCVFYLCNGGGLLDFGIFMCVTSNGVGNVTYNPIIQSSNPPSVRTVDIENGKMSFTIRRNTTYDRMYMSMPEGGITIS